MFEYFFLIIWHVGKPKEPKKGTLKILPQNLNPPPGGPLCPVQYFAEHFRYLTKKRKLNIHYKTWKILHFAEEKELFFEHEINIYFQ